jgi:hypothetical protein
MQFTAPCRFTAELPNMVALIVCLALLVGTTVGSAFDQRTGLEPNEKNFSDQDKQRRSATTDEDPGVNLNYAPRDQRQSPNHLKSRRWSSEYRTYRFAAVTTDTNICSEIGVLDWISLSVVLFL